MRVKTDPENGSPDGYNDVFKLEEGGKTHTRYLTKMELSE